MKNFPTFFFFKNCLFDPKNPFFDQENHFFGNEIIFLDPKSLIFMKFHHILTHFHHIWSYFDLFFDFHDFCRANYSQGHLFGNHGKQRQNGKTTIATITQIMIRMIRHEIYHIQLRRNWDHYVYYCRLFQM